MDASTKGAYGQKYFDLANAITGFAVVQMITFLVALGTSDNFAAHVRAAPGFGIVISAMCIAAVLYAGAVIACGRVELKFMRGADDIDLWQLKLTMYARVGVIFVVSGFGLFVMAEISALAL